MGHYGAIEIATALAGVVPEAEDTAAMEAAVRCLLFDLWSGLPILDGEIEALLEGTWPGAVLNRMKEHDKRKQAARRAHADFQAIAAQRKRLKAQQHQERLERKKERDRLWRAGQGRSTDPV